MPVNLTSNIELIFRGTNLIGTAATNALRDINRFNNGVQSAVAPLALLTTGVLALEAAGARYAITFAKDSFNAATDFARSQTELAKVLGDNEGTVEDYTKQVFDLSNTFAVSATETLGSVAAWKQAGFTAKEAGDLTSQALKLVIAGDIEAARASELLIRSIKGFGLEVSETEPFLDALNAVTNNFGVTLDQLGEGMARIAPISENLGFTYQEMAAFLTPVITQTQSAEISSRALKSAFLNLSNPTAEMRQRLLDLGVAVEDDNLQLRSVKDIITDLAPVFNGLTREQKLQTAAVLANKEAAAAFTTALEKTDVSARVLNVALNSSGSIMKEVEARLGSNAFKVDQLNTSYVNLLVTIGRQFQDELGNVVEGFSKITQTLSELGEAGGLDEFFAEINPRLVDIRRIADQIAAALPEALENADFTGFGRGLDALFGDLSNLQIDDANLTEFITSIGNGFEDLAKFTDGVIDVFTAVAEVVGPLITSFADLDSGTQELLVEIAGGAAVISLFGGAITGLIGIASGAVGGFKLLAGGFATLFARATAVSPFLAGTLTSSITGVGAAAAAGVIGVGALAFELFRLSGAGADVAAALDPNKIDPIFRAFDRYVLRIDRAAEASSAAAVDIQKTDTAIQALAKSANDDVFGGFGEELDSLLSKTEPVIDGLTEVDRVIREAAAQEIQPLNLDFKVPELQPLENFIGAVDDAGNIIPSTLRLIGSTAIESGNQVEQGVNKAIKASDEFKLKALEIASEERIAVIQSRFEFDIAKLDADTRQIEAAFDSIDTTIDSTGDLIGSLFGSLAGLDRFEQLDVRRQIEREDKRRQQALDLQTKLVEAQIDKIEAQTRQLRKGKALIQVDASPLQPHLQSILHEILAAIQIQASADFQDFLLNINPQLPGATGAGA